MIRHGVVTPATALALGQGDERPGASAGDRGCLSYRAVTSDAVMSLCECVDERRWFVRMPSMASARDDSRLRRWTGSGRAGRDEVGTRARVSAERHMSYSSPTRCLVAVHPSSRCLLRGSGSSRAAHKLAHGRHSAAACNNTAAHAAIKCQHHIEGADACCGECRSAARGSNEDRARDSTETHPDSARSGAGSMERARLGTHMRNLSSLRDIKSTLSTQSRQLRSSSRCNIDSNLREKSPQIAAGGLEKVFLCVKTKLQKP